MILADRPLRWWHWLLMPLSGSSITLSLAPFNFWPLALIGLSLLAMTIRHRRSFMVFALCLLFGLGLFATGASWVYVSIHTYGIPSMPIAVGLTLLFVTALAFLFALPWCFYPRFGRTEWSALLAFPAFWVLSEGLRSVLFTGFPWLMVGYGHSETPLAFWAPLIGVLGIGFIVAFTAATFASVSQWLPGRLRTLASVGFCVLFWAIGFMFQDYEWTHPQGRPLNVALVQGNIPQSLKWVEGERERILQTYASLSQNEWGTDLIIWPEAALPVPRHQALDLLQTIHDNAAAQNTAFITGIPIFNIETGGYQNSAIALGKGSGEYHKQKLVPFGEYLPLRHWIGPVFDLFHLPLSDISAGAPHQPHLMVQEIAIAMAICYEIAYADLVSVSAQEAGLILTLSNDTWFGRSIGPNQHFEIARMRALENAKPVLRVTNSGITGIIGATGEVLSTLDTFVPAVLEAEVQPRQGRTPFNRWGERPVLLLAGALLLICLLARRRSTY